MSTSLTHFLFLIDKDCSSRGPDADYGTDEKTQLELRLHDGLSRYLPKPYHPVKDRRHRAPATPTRDNPFQGPQNTLTGKPKGPPEQKEAQPPQDYGLPPRAKCASIQFRNINLIAVGVAHIQAPLAPRQVWNRPHRPVAQSMKPPERRKNLPMLVPLQGPPQVPTNPRATDVAEETSPTSPPRSVA